MNDRTFKTFRINILVIILLFVTGLWFVFSDSSPINRASALNATREWARLAPYPESAHRFDIETTGNIFTRGFIIVFEGSPEEINSWIAESPGTKEAIPVTYDDGSVYYKIEPGGGACFAELKLSGDGKTIYIRTYWS